MGFRAWGPKQGKVYARSVPNTQVNAVQPVGFAGGGDQCKISNTGATDVLVCFYSHSAGEPALTFPADGAPPTGQNAGAGRVDAVVTLVLHGTEKQVSIPATADSFAAIASAAGPSLIYVQRGDGST